MIEDGPTAREILEEIMDDPARKKFGFGEKLAILNADIQQVYTRTDTENSLQNIKYGSPRHKYDPRCEIEPPANRRRKSRRKPHRDVAGYSHRDHSNRVSRLRMADVMERHGFLGSVSLSVALCQHHPEVIADAERRGWEFFSHGICNNRYSYGMDESQERATIKDSIRTVQNATGQRIHSWLAPAFTRIPKRFGGRMFPLHLTPYITGLPYRIEAFEQLLDDLASRVEAWFATGGEIVEAWEKQTKSPPLRGRVRSREAAEGAGEP